jgi:hypothetical protein
MAVSFSELKKQRKSDFERIQKEIEKVSQKGGSSDDATYWSPGLDKAGNGYAIIRFLPAPPGEDSTFVRLFTHGFKGPTGKWYIENSLTTLGQKDPVGELNSTLWNSTEDDEAPARKQARAQKRRLGFVSNIYVVKDAANPENEGKVFRFKYGKKIWDKVQAVMYPEIAGEEGFNPFDLWEGANFKLKIRQVAGFKNYDNSHFDSPAPLSDDDDELDKVWQAEHSLAGLIAPDQFKSYAELETRLKEVLGEAGGSSRQVTRNAESLTHDAPAEYRPRNTPRVAEQQDAPAVDGDDGLPWSDNKSASATKSGEEDLDQWFADLGK